MINMSIGSKKFAEALKNIKYYSESVQKEVQKAVAATAIEIESEAKRLVPVDSGRLKTSIVSDFTQIRKFGATVSTNVEYAKFVEFGTSKVRARPFMFPPVPRARRKFIQKVTDILQP